MTIEYTPRGVCSRFFSIQVEDPCRLSAAATAT